MRSIAIIPARSGSKGLLDKNIKPLLGKPLLAYSIEDAINSGCFDCVHVSTDSEIYADIARQYNADVPFLRSAEQSGDAAGSWDVVEEVLDKYSKLGQSFDVVALLQPTSPLRGADNITKAMQMMQNNKVKAVVSVCEMEHSPLWCNILPSDGSMNNFLKGRESAPRQQLNTFYRINGALYCVNVDFLRESHNLYRDGCYSYIMDTRKSIDIDTQLDFDMATALMQLEK